MCKKIFLFVFISLFLVNLVFAESIYKLPSVVVTATKYPQELEKIGSNVKVITSEELKSSGITNLKDALALVSDLSVISAGGNVSVYMSGLPSNQVKIMIDGIELRDVTTPQGTPYLDAILINNNVDYIEIVSGSNSTLYGTDAIGGVINIITKKGSNYFNIEAGPNNYMGDIIYNFKINTVQIDFGLSYLYDKNISSLKNTSEFDGKSQTAFSLSFADKTDYFSYKGFFKRNLATLDLDNYISPTNFVDDPNYVLNSAQDLSKLSFFLPEIYFFKPTVGYYASTLKREVDNPTDNVDAFSYNNSVHESRINFLDIRLLTSPLPNFDFLLGYDYKRENASFSSNWSGWVSTMNETDYVNGIYSQISFLNDVVNFNGGIRHTFFKKKNISTYSLSLFRNIPFLDVIAKVNYSTGYREPSLSEKYGPWGANASLNPEQSTTKEISFEKKIFGSTLKATFFDHLITDKIDYVLSYENVTGNTKSKGTNLSFFSNNLLWLDFVKIDYTQNNATWGQQKAPRIPDYKINCATAVSFSNLQIGLNALNVGPRTDKVYADVFNLSSYYLLNTKIQYTFADNFNCYLTVNNLFNRDYEEIQGYNVLGRMFKMGFNFHLN